VTNRFARSAHRLVIPTKVGIHKAGASRPFFDAEARSAHRLVIPTKVGIHKAGASRPF